MVDSAVTSCCFNGHDVANVFYNTNHSMITCWVGTDRTYFFIGNISAAITIVMFSLMALTAFENRSISSGERFKSSSTNRKALLFPMLGKEANCSTASFRYFEGKFTATKLSSIY